MKEKENKTNTKPIEKTKTKKETETSAAKKDLSKYYPLIASPLVVMFIVLMVFYRYGFYPFGTRTIAWADMNQQVVPLLCQFKDILEGNGGGVNGMFLSFKNSSGMNFWGVFFFFLSSPLTLLVRFVRKEDMLIFMNILVLVKMMLCSASACFYFIKSRLHRSLGSIEICFLGFVYATCGYTMLYYQNVIWLDVMYLFPLLLLSLEYMLDNGREKGKGKSSKGSPIPYTLLMAATVTVHYYLGYMAVVFVLLFMGLYAIMLIRGKNEQSSSAFLKFLIGSGIAALMSAVVWLPSFMQYLTSGRKTSLYDNLRSGELITEYKTIIPVIICSSALVMLSVLGVKKIFGREALSLPENEVQIRRHRVIMAGLMLIPIFIEPINKMWHTGSYMAFPSRYSFITTFMMIIMASYALSDTYKYGGDKLNCTVWTAEGFVVAIMFGYITMSFINISYADISAYTMGLNGTEHSFKGFMRLFIIGLLVCISFYATYRRGFVPKKVFLCLLALLTFFETFNNTRIYMTSSGIESQETYALQREITKLSDRIEDDSFYRVKTSAKIFDYNMIGAMDYNSIGSYTSLNDQDYLFTMKRLGYTSVWMEIGTCGGTELTDSMLSVGYKIDHDQRSDTIYTLGTYNINRMNNKLPLGICFDSLPAEKEIPEQLDRAGVQSYLSQMLFGKDIIERYEPDEGTYIITTDGKYSILEDDIYVYRIHVDGKKTLYFDCFDRLSTDLSEEQYDSFLVQANGKTICRSYPYSKENGVLKLGTFKDENVIIQLTALQDVECKSFGIFSLDTKELSECVSEAQTCDLHEIKNGLSGTADTEAPRTVLLSVPYNEGFTVRVNGKETAYREVLSSFMAFDLPAGHSDIEITFKPRGFTLGLVMSVIGFAAFAAYTVILRRKPKKLGEAFSDEKREFCNRIGCYLTAAFGIMIFLLVYILPLALNFLFWKPEQK